MGSVDSVGTVGGVELAVSSGTVVGVVLEETSAGSLGLSVTGVLETTESGVVVDRDPSSSLPCTELCSGTGLGMTGMVLDAVVSDVTKVEDAD